MLLATKPSGSCWVIPQVAHSISKPNKGELQKASWKLIKLHASAIKSVIRALLMKWWLPLQSFLFFNQRREGHSEPSHKARSEQRWVGIVSPAGPLWAWGLSISTGSMGLRPLSTKCVLMALQSPLALCQADAASSWQGAHMNTRFWNAVSTFLTGLLTWKRFSGLHHAGWYKQFY